MFYRFAFLCFALSGEVQVIQEQILVVRQLHHNPFSRFPAIGLLADECQACRWMALPLAPGSDAAEVELAYRDMSTNPTQRLEKVYKIYICNRDADEISSHL